MCNQATAIDIMKNVYAECGSFIPNLKNAYLYGSYARGDYHASSDVDILLTADAGQAELEAFRMSVAKVASRMSLKNDVTVSVTVKPEEQFNRFSKDLPFYKNVLSEGIRYAE